MNVRELTKSALMAALLCVVSPFSVPFGPIPLSLATFGVYLSAIILKPGVAVLSVAVYIILGAFGLPVFSGANGGAGVIAGPTGGYVIGYIFCVLIASLAKNKTNIPVALSLGTVTLYVFGTAWFMLVTESTLFQSFAVCILPFLPGDALKITAATVVGEKLKKRIT